MGNVVNLNLIRKRAQREVSAKQAEANRARFGRTKSQRMMDQERTMRAKELLEQHRIEHEATS